MNRLMISVACFSCVVSASAATSFWIGASGARGAANWSDAANWDGGVPTGDATAVIPRVSRVKPRVVLVPASDFTGTLILSNGVATSSSEIGMAMHVVLSNDVDSAWTVTGPGWLVATPGIAPRIADTFTGTIEVPKGVSLELPNNLHSNAVVVGAGDLTLANASQIVQAQGFAGKVKVAGSTYAPTDIAQIMSRSASLGDGQTLSLSDNVLALGGVHAISGFEQASDWKIVGNTWATGPEDLDVPYSTQLPTPAADGSLKLVDDPAQTRVAIHKGHRMRLQDSWGVSFTHIPELPANSRFVQAGHLQYWSGYFMFGLVNTLSPTLPASGIYSSGFWGYGGYYYRNSSDQRYLFCANGSTANNGVYELVMNGISMIQPVDVTVTCVNGLFTVTLVQGELSFTMRRDYRELLKSNPSGLWLAFSACSDNWGGNTSIPWSTHTIRNFRGWYRNAVDANWATHSKAADFLPVSTDTWAVNTLDSVNNVTNDTSAIAANGDFVVLKNSANYKGNFHSKKTLSRDGRFLMSFDLEMTDGNLTDSSGRFTFGVVDWLPTNWQCTNFSGEWDGKWAKGWCGFWNFWQGTTAKCLTLRNSYVVNSKRSDVIVANYADTPIVPAGSIGHVDYIYDAKGTLRIGVTVTNKTTGAGFARDYVQTLTSERWTTFRNNFSGGMYLDFRGAFSWGPFEMTVRNLALKEVVSNADVPINSPLAVEPGASATLSVGATDAASATPAATFARVELGAGATLTVSPEGTGAKVGVASVKANGAANLTAGSGAGVRTLGEIVLSGTPASSALTLSGDIAFADPLTLVVPGDWTSHAEPIVALDLSAATGTPPNLSTLTVVTDAGADVTSHVTCSFMNGLLRLCFARGTMVIFR